MKPAQQVKALAELDGLTNLQWLSGHLNHGSGFGEPVPAYLTRYDAIIPLLQKQLKDTNVSGNFFAEIEQPFGCTGEDVLSRTPAQLCEALLRATGKWTK